MLRVIVESPYAGDVKRNTEYARRCLRHCLDRGETPYASHLLLTQPHVLDETIQKERERGIQAGYSWFPAADIIAFYVDFGWSPGMIRALKTARILLASKAGKYEIEARSLEYPVRNYQQWPA